MRTINNITNPDKRLRIAKETMEITRLANSAPDSLSVEELLYAGTLTNDVNNKVQI